MSATLEALPAAWTALGGVPCVLEQQRLPLRLRAERDRGARCATAQWCTCRCSRTCTAMASWPSRRCRHPTCPMPAPPNVAVASWPQQPGAGTSTMSVCFCVEFFLLDDGSPGGQRDGAAAAQLRPLQHRRLRCLAVRSPGAHAGRAAAGGAAPALGRSVMLNLLGDLWFTGSDSKQAHHARLGRPCWPCRACGCTSTARPSPGAAARWVTSRSPRRCAARGTRRWHCRRHRGSACRRSEAQGALPMAVRSGARPRKP